MKNFYENARKLDRLKVTAEPNQVELEEFLSIIKEDEALEFYFYEENDLGPRPTAGWVKLLAEAGEFEVLKGAEASNKPVPRLKAIYLAESAKEVPEEVLKVTGSIKTKDEWTQGKFLEAVKNMPDDYIEKGDWIFWEVFRSSQAMVWFYAGRSATKLMFKMIDINPDKAFGMARFLLELRVSEKKDSYFEKATSHFENYNYEEFIQAYCKEICSRYPVRATQVLISILSDYLEAANKEEDTEAKDFLYFTVRDLAANERFERNCLSMLIGGICEAGKIAIQKEPENLGELFKTIISCKEGIFKRIEMYLLYFVDDQAYTERINEIIASRDNFDNKYIELEYVRLLKGKFGNLTEDTKNRYIEWIKGIHIDEKEKYNKWFIETNGRACTDADIEKYENGMRAQKLYDVREVFPELYKEVSEKSKWSEEDIRPWRTGEVRSFDPSENAPKTKDEILEMSIDDVFAYVSDPENYKDTGKGYKPSSAKDGLAYEFQMAIKEKPVDYLNASVEVVIVLDEDFLSKYFYGIWDAIRERKVEGFDWDRYLETAKATVDKYAPKGEIQRAFHPLVNSLRECFTGNNQIEYTFERLEAIYYIVRPLLEFKEDKDISSEKDPVQLRGNSVTGEALERCVSLGIVCRRDFEEQWQGSFRGKIRNAFEKALNEIKTPWTCCTFGSDFARIYWLDPEWVESNIEEILSEELWSIVWNTYLFWGRPSRELFRFLDARGIYDRAIGLIGTSANKAESSREDPDNKLADHVVIAYFNGWLEEDHSQLLERFLERASDKLRRHAARFFTTGFKSLQEEEGRDEQTVCRLRMYWESRLDAILQQPEEHLEEAMALACWVINAPFPSKETLKLVSKTLKITKGKFDRNRDVYYFVNSLCDLSKGNEFQAVICIRKVINNESAAMHFSFYEEKLTGLLSAILKSIKTSKKLLQESAKLTDELGRLHIYKYRAVHAKLVEKIKKNKVKEVGEAEGTVV